MLFELFFSAFCEKRNQKLLGDTMYRYTPLVSGAKSNDLERRLGTLMTLGTLKSIRSLMTSRRAQKRQRAR